MLKMLANHPDFLIDLLVSEKFDYLNFNNVIDSVVVEKQIIV